MIHLDTHVVVWLYAGLTERFPESVRDVLSSRQLLASPMVRLELQLLREVGRITATPAEILEYLRIHGGLRVAESRFERVAAMAAEQSWTRDPFDRMIAAHALADDLPLITKDRTILAHCSVARWE